MEYISLLIHSGDQILLKKVKYEDFNDEFWIFPVDKLERMESWKQQIENQLQQIFSIDDQDGDDGVELASKSVVIHKNLELLKILRLWVPNSEYYWERKVFYKKISENERLTLQLNSDYRWINISDCYGKLDPESLELVSKITKGFNNGSGFTTKIREYTRDQFLSNISNESSSGENSKRRESMNDYAIQNQLLQAAKLDITDKIRVYQEYLNRVFPNLFMNWYQFHSFFRDFEWPSDSITKLFKCFQNNDTKMDYLSFSDFLSGIAALEPETPHGGISGNIRSTLIFKYYSTEDNNEMSFDDFTEMITDIRIAKGISVDSKQEIIDEAIQSSKVFGEDQSSKLSLSNFLTAVDQLKFRGTSFLLRSPKSIVEHLISKNRAKKSRKRQKTGSTHYDDDDVFSSPHPPAAPPSSSSTTMNKRKRKTSSSSFATSVSFEDDNDDNDVINPHYSFTPSKYEFATHAVKVKRSGQVTDVQSLWDLESVGAVTSNSVFAPELKRRLERIHSVRAFNSSTDANEMLRGLKFFERATNGNERTPKKSALNWGNVSYSINSRACENHYRKGDTPLYFDILKVHDNFKPVM